MIYYNEGKVGFAKGDSILVSAVLGEYTIQWDYRLIKSYSPDVKTVEEEILIL